jgi:predicted Zn-dependent peptidase
MFRRSVPAALLMTIFVATSAPAQQVKYEKYQLPNGMTVILHEDHSLPITCINTWYYVGSKDEAPGRSGFAHLFEHLMFMGTRRVPTGAFDQLMETEGGSNNASTSEDRTNYYSIGPSSLLPTLLWLDADRLEDLGKEMTKDKLDKQREVVRNERRQTSEMRPYGKSELKISELMYPPEHPYHHTVIGSHEDLEAATVRDVKDFFAAYYVPNNASLVVAGDFDSSQIKPLIAKLFGTLPRSGTPAHSKAEPASLSEVRRVTYTDTVQFPRTTIVYHSPAQFAPGDAAGPRRGDSQRRHFQPPVQTTDLSGQARHGRRGEPAIRSTRVAVFD